MWPKVEIVPEECMKPNFPYFASSFFQQDQRPSLSTIMKIRCFWACALCRRLNHPDTGACFVKRCTAWPAWHAERLACTYEPSLIHLKDVQHTFGKAALAFDSEDRFARCEKASVTSRATRRYEQTKIVSNRRRTMTAISSRVKHGPDAI